MPAGRPAAGGGGGSTAALIFFVILTVILGVTAFLLYMQMGKYQTQFETLNAQVQEIANPGERNSLGKLVGKPERGKSYMGTLLDYVNSLSSHITGNVSEESPAAVKYSESVQAINDLSQKLQGYVETTYGPEGIDLVYTVNSLKDQLDAANQDAATLENALKTLQDDFDQYVRNFNLEKQQLMQDKARAMADADQIQQNYQQLRDQMEKASDEQLQTFMQTRKKAEEDLEQTSQELMKTRARLDKTETDLQSAMTTIEGIKPRPDVEMEAFQPDAQIVNIDTKAGVVFLNIGSDDHVYRGLTFSVYDPSVPIPQDGMGKAELEIFRVTPKASAAKIVRQETRNPVARGDIVANLIWDSAKANKFVIAGEFDINRDGKDDLNGTEKVIELVERWGGEVMDEVNINTDFVVLGTPPNQMARPTLQQIENDPLIQQRYQSSQERMDRYNAILAAANKLNIPVFNQDRFFNLIGYETLSSRSTPIF